MELYNKFRKAYRMLREQGVRAVLRKSRARLQNRFSHPPRPIDLQNWLSFYRQRKEISLKSLRDKDFIKWPKVSILILTYNNLLINELCLKSIYCNTTYPNFEVIVVDNASNDETPGWLSSFAKAHPNLRLILNTENIGFARGNNQAAKFASGDYLIFLNNDTVVTSGWVERLLDYMKNDPTVGLVGPVTNSTGNEARILTSYHLPTQMEALAAKRAKKMAGQAFDIRMLAFYCVMARKDQYIALGGLDERFLVGMFEDDDLAVRYHLKGLRVVCAEDVFIHHFQGASFGKLDNEAYQKIFDENRKKYEEKWGHPWEAYQIREEI